MHQKRQRQLQSETPKTTTIWPSRGTSQGQSPNRRSINYDYNLDIRLWTLMHQKRKRLLKSGRHGGHQRDRVKTDEASNTTTIWILGFEKCCIRNAKDDYNLAATGDIRGTEPKQTKHKMRLQSGYEALRNYASETQKTTTIWPPRGTSEGQCQNRRSTKDDYNLDIRPWEMMNNDASETANTTTIWGVMPCVALCC